MGFSVKYVSYLTFIVLLLANISFSYSDDKFVTSRATYYSRPDGLGTPTGACGYGEYGRTVYYGKVTGVAGLWRNGIGCGACYQVKCTNGELCSYQGTNVVVTDYGQGDRTDFILSSAAYAAMARNNTAARRLYSYGVVDVQFRRVACHYGRYHLTFKVQEQSNYPNYLAIVILRVGGENDILEVEAWEADRTQWRPMRRSYGAVFDLENPPRGVISLRFRVKGSAGKTWVEATNVIPAYWKPGVAYESQIMLN